MELEFKNKTELSCSFLVEDETKLIVEWLRDGVGWVIQFTGYFDIKIYLVH